MNNQQSTPIPYNGNVTVEAVDNQINNANASTNSSIGTFDEKNYLNLRLDKGVNERRVIVRILPVSATDGRFCTEIKTHSLKLSQKIAKSGFKSFVCLNDKNLDAKYKESDGCPLCNKANELLAAAKKAKEVENDDVKSKTIFKEATQYFSKKTYIVRVIERGKENEGVKFWRFNENSKKEGCYDKLINLYRTRKEEMALSGVPDYNIFDLSNGKDIVLTLKKAVRADGKETVSIDIMDAGMPTPLSQDVDLANSWINDPKKWNDAYAVKNGNYLSIIAEGLIPVKNRETGLYEGRSEEDFETKPYKREEMPQQTAPQASVPSVPADAMPQSEVADDLPF